ncbi:MAG: LysE family translocator, partial [Nevskiales bacterium]
VFVALALLGMTLIAEWLGALFSLVKYCAAAYLIWLGVGLLRSKGRYAVEQSTANAATLFADFLAGLFLTLGDVKAILFYASLFPALVNLQQLQLMDVVAIVGITMLTVGGVKLAYVFCAASIIETLRTKTTSALPRKLGGAFMIGCGSVLITKA